MEKSLCPHSLRMDLQLRVQQNVGSAGQDTHPSITERGQATKILHGEIRAGLVGATDPSLEPVRLQRAA